MWLFFKRIINAHPVLRKCAIRGLHAFHFLFPRIKVGKNTKVDRSCKLKAHGGSIVIGIDCNIHPYAMLLAHGGNIIIGNNCTVNPFSILYGHGGLVVGNGVRIAAHCVIIPANHNFKDSNQYIYKQGVTAKGIIIKDDVWIGVGARILDGITVGKGSVIGAGAVVTRDVEAFTVVAGVPARMIGKRGVQSE